MTTARTLSSSPHLPVTQSPRPFLLHPSSFSFGLDRSPRLVDCYSPLTVRPNLSEELPMKKLLSLVFALLCACAAARAQERAVAFTGATVITVSGQTITDGVLVVRRGKIVAVGPRGSTQNPADAQVGDAAGKTIMPGLVDTHSHIGRGAGAGS